MHFFHSVPENSICCGCTGRFRLSACQSCPTHGYDTRDSL